MTYFIVAAAATVAAVATYGYGRHRQRRALRSDARRRLSRTMAGARAGAGRSRD
ncbi:MULTISPECIES: hypothetical protein [Sphingomonas]|jgi:hypothetical protein|uniref:hypothetical protein n=1 Tax=Sphingomonas TaxID=13687 RepID=UPI000B14A198|nr:MULTISPECIES: hypothetical protein [Sphingomonas]